MIKTLQKKFIVTAMIAVTVLLVLLLGGLSVINAWSAAQETRSLLSALVELESGQRPAFEGTRPEEPPFPPGGQTAPSQARDDELPDDDRDENGRDDDLQDDDRDGNGWDDDLWDDDRGEPPFGRGQRSPQGFMTDDLTENDRLSAVYFTARFEGGTLSAVDVSRIKSVSAEEAEALAAKVLAAGKSAGTSGTLRYDSAERGGVRTYVFLETSAQRNAVLRVIALAALAAVVGWVLMLVLVIFLSKKAIRPIAANMERQRQFVTDAGHELKTPLAIIQANTEAMELLQGESKWSRNIRAQVLRLSDLTRNLLVLARAEEVPTEGSFAPVEFSALCEQSVQMFHAPAELRELQLAAEIDPGLVLRGSASQLSTLLSILLDNAVKYAVSGSTVRLRLERGEKEARLWVENRCEQLPDCPPDQLFDRFYRGDSARTQRSGSFGIGLSAAQVIAHRHKGSLAAEYCGDAIRFTLRLPVG